MPSSRYVVPSGPLFPGIHLSSTLWGGVPAQLRLLLMFQLMCFATDSPFAERTTFPIGILEYVRLCLCDSHSDASLIPLRPNFKRIPSPTVIFIHLQLHLISPIPELTPTPRTTRRIGPRTLDVP